MIKYYKVIIDETSKPMGNNNEGYGIFNRITETFGTINEAKKWLKDKYQNNKKVKMFQDDKMGNSHQTGWIYCFNNRDLSHNSDWWRQQDWVQVKEVKEKIVLT